MLHKKLFKYNVDDRILNSSNGQNWDLYLFNKKLRCSQANGLLAFLVKLNYIFKSYLSIAS